jgi:hypothetical protein
MPFHIIVSCHHLTLNAPWPHRVTQMLVGSFAALFGSAEGARLQRWCRARGWVLAWALGAAAGGGYSPGAALYANRSLDPLVLGAKGGGGMVPFCGAIFGPYSEVPSDS